MRRFASRSSSKSCRKWWNDSFRPSRRPEMPRTVKKIRRARRRPALAILSRKKTLYSTRRLIEAANARGFRARVIDVLRCNLALESEGARLYHKGKEVSALRLDRKSTRLNSSHDQISYAVFCLKKKK